MGKDEETIDFIVRSEVKARWADLQFGRAEDPSMFDYCGPGLLAEAASLGMLAQCAEMYEAGITIDPNDGCVREALFDAVNDRSIRTSLIMSALGADLGDLGSEGLFSYDFIQALEKEKIRIQEEWKAEDEATRLQMEKRRTAMATDNPQPSVDRSRPALPEIVEGWQRVNAHLTQSEVQGLLGNPPPQPTPAVYDAPDYDWQGHPNELDEPSKEPVNATKSEAMSVQWVSARFAEAVEIAKRMAIQQGEEIHLRRLSDGWGIPNCREPLAEPGLFPEIADGPEPTAIGLAPPDWEDGSPDEVNVEHYGSYSHSLDVD